MNWVKRLVWLEPFWVFVVAPVLLLPGRFIPSAWAGSVTNWQPIALAILGLGWPLRWLAYGRPTRPAPVNIPIFLLLLWLPVNYWAAVDKTLALNGVSYLLLGVAVYFASINWPPTVARPQRIGWIILIIGFFLTIAAPFLSNLALSTLFQIPGLSPLLQKLADLTPGNVNENRMAGALALLAPIFWAVGLARRQSWWLRLFSLLTGSIILTLLVLSQSRGALLAVATSLALLLFMRWPRLLWGSPILIAGFAFALYRLGPDVLVSLGSNGDLLGGFDGRLEIWSRAIYAAQDFAFTGLGIGNFQKVIPILYPLFLIAPDTVVEHAHNLWLQVVVDLGFPGLIAYLAIQINVFVLLARILRQRAYDLNWTLAAGTAAGMTAMYVQGVIDAPLWGSKPAFIVWILVALAVQLGTTAKELSTNNFSDQGDDSASNGRFSAKNIKS